MVAQKSISFLISLLLVSLLLISCVPGTDPATEAAIAENLPQDTPTEESTATNTPDLQATTDAQSTAEAILTLEAQETADAQASATSIAEETQKALDSQATATQAMAIKQTSTADAIRQATAQADVMAVQIERLVEDGLVADTQGSYVRLKKFDESWAQMNWFQWWPTGYNLENFALRTDLKWSSASETANWFNSGCGFVFGLADSNNFHVVHLMLDGFVALKYWVNGNGNWIAQRPAGTLTTPDGEAEIMVVVYDKRVSFYIDGEKKLSEHAGLLKPGELALTLVSGTNKGYGTRCTMTDIDLWIFE